MSIYEIQFQKGLSLPDFLHEFGSEDQCEAYIFSMKWPSGFKCSKCGHEHMTSFKRRDRTIHQCTNCTKQHSLLVGTLFQGTHLPLTKWFMAIYFISEAKTSIASLDLHRKLGINHKTAWLMHQKLMQAMVTDEKKTKIGRRIELDDAYLGGKLKGGKAGRGSENKQPFIAAVETTFEDHIPLRAKIDPVEGFTRTEVDKWLGEHVEAGSHIVSDGLDCFKAVEATCSHEVHISSRLSDQEKEVHFKWVNTILSNLKTSLSGTFHSIECHKYCLRYLGAFVYRFNRRQDLTAIFYDLCSTAINSPPLTAASLKV